MTLFVKGHLFRRVSNMKIIIDAMGGDNPEEVVKGAAQAAKEFKDVKFVVVGDHEVIDGVLAAENAAAALEVVATTEVVTNEESPTMAIKTKKDSSMVVALNLLKNDDDAIGMISTGSTGAVLTGGSLIIGRLPGIYRPTLLAQLPNVEGGVVCVADGGANVDSRPEWLYQFAVMGNAYMRAMTGKDKPVVALLSVGTEEHKGNELTRAAYALLQSSGLNFVGNMEARDALCGKYDVLVCDGYDGNILIKSNEGAAKTIMTMLKQNITASTSAKIGYLFMKKALRKLRDQMDFNNYGGAPFLGIKKCVIKAHGASKAAAIYNSVIQTMKIHAGDVVKSIEEEVAKNL